MAEPKGQNNLKKSGRVEIKPETSTKLRGVRFDFQGYNSVLRWVQSWRKECKFFGNQLISRLQSVHFSLPYSYTLSYIYVAILYNIKYIQILVEKNGSAH